MVHRRALGEDHRAAGVVGGDESDGVPLRLRIRMSRTEIQGTKTASLVDDVAVSGELAMEVGHRWASADSTRVLGLELVVRTRC